ncbi:MAG: YcaQ family DNA glycosylase [Polyangiaceae bacterium]|nr:YcaQ family DNA glycosylase [Polyangiaceae bacterium]
MSASRSLSLVDLRRFALARSLVESRSLAAAVERMGFVQADPIRAPARAQDLILRHRVSGHRAGDLERRYGKLAIEEDSFVNYGFLPRRHVELMHPRAPRRAWDKPTTRLAARVLEFVRELGEAHPRQVDAHFARGTVRNYWGGSSSATTHLLDGMHFRGLLRVARRDAGIRIYAPREPATKPPGASSRQAAADALLALAVALYAPLPKATLGQLTSRLRHSAPQLSTELGAALRRAHSQLGRARIADVDWYWPAAEEPLRFADWDRSERVRFVAPFDPIVWDRRRFEHFWGWAYRFEAYTPVARRKLGYYALPLVWRDQAIGWCNFTAEGVRLGYVAGHAPRERAYLRELDAEVERMRRFLEVR